jgi:hypothetical protein
MDMIKEVISHLRRFEGMYISKKLERYLIEELEEDLFPYGFGAGDLDAVYYNVKAAIASVNCGDINISGSVEERLAGRYDLLKEAHLDLLAEINRNAYHDEDGDGYDMSF